MRRRRVVTTATATALAALAAAGCTRPPQPPPPLPAALTDQQLVDRARTGVVAVLARGPEGATTGTGFVVDAGRGLVLTAAHVTQDAGNIKVRLADRTTRPARKIGEQKCGDISLLQIVGDVRGLTMLPLAPGGRPAPETRGTLLHYGANIEGFGRQSMSTSRLTLSNPLVEHPELPSSLPPVAPLLQWQGVVPRGASGGAILDRNGLVLGMAVLGEREQSQAYALRVEELRAALPALRRGLRQDLLGLSGLSVRDVDLAQVFAHDPDYSQLGGGALGAAVAALLRRDGVTGFYVTSTSGAAEDAGVGFGDLITHVNGTRVRSMRGLCGVLDSTSPGERVTVRGVQINSGTTIREVGRPFRVTLKTRR
jgi:S1-C subfamily serine protease